MIKIGVTGDFLLMEKEIQLLKEIPEFILTGIYHPNKKLLGKIEEKYDIPRFPSSYSLAESCDAIDITGNHIDNSGLITSALKNSKHLIIDFPGESSKEYLKYLTKLTSEAKAILQIRNTYRFNPAFLVCLSKINKPSVIEIQMEINNNTKFDDHLVLCIDLLKDMVRSNTRKISATGISAARNKLDYLTSRIEFDNGSIANISINHFSHRDSLNVKIFQTGNRIFINFLKKECYIENIPFSLFPCNNDVSNEKQFPKINNTNPASEELKQFRNAIIKNLSTGIDIERAMHSIDIYREIVEKINKTTIHPFKS